MLFRMSFVIWLAVCLWPGMADAAVARETGIGPVVQVAADGSPQALAALDAQILSAVILAHSIWTTERFSAFAARLASMYPNDAEILNRIAARYRNDQDGHLDLYSSIVLQIATGPARLNVRARINQAEQDLDEQGLGQFKRFLPLLLKNVDEAQTGTAMSREQRRIAILAVPSAKPTSGD